MRSMMVLAVWAVTVVGVMCLAQSVQDGGFGAESDHGNNPDVAEGGIPYEPCDEDHWDVCEGRHGVWWSNLHRCIDVYECAYGGCMECDLFDAFCVGDAQYHLYNCSGGAIDLMLVQASGGGVRDFVFVLSALYE